MYSVNEIILASQSSFRKQLLTAAGISFEAVSPRFDEYAIKNLPPAKLALARAIGKAQEVATRHARGLVIGADQVLVFEGKTFDKATSRDEAFQRLQELSGKTHHLVNGICLVFTPDRDTQPRVLFEDTVSVEMKMRALSAAEINAYLDLSFEWQGVVGCYQYENMGVHLLEKVSGDHSAIIGLPLLPLLEAFRKLGMELLMQPKGPWLVKA